MFLNARFDFSQWLPRPGEGPFEYWASLSPMAPMFGVDWRFGAIEVQPPLRKPAKRKSPIKADAAEAEVVPEPVVVPEVAAETAPAAEVSAETVAESVAETVAEAAQTPADDLTVIKGIGPKMAERLAALGVTTFAQIAAWDAAAIARMEDALGGLPGAISRADWVGQARVLAG